MRTKTLILSAIAGALSCASMMGQVYSLNAVGYINVTCPPGYSIIADQLNSGNNVLTNVIPVDPAGSEDGDSIVKYTTAGGFQIYHLDSGAGSPPWDEPGANTATLNPGEAAFFNNIYTNTVTITFVGTVMQATNLTVSLPVGFDLVSSMVPQAGGLTSVLGLTIDPGGTQDGDQIQTFVNHTVGFQIYPIDSSQTSGYQGAEPVIAVGQGFFYHRISVNGPGAATWVRSFAVN